MSYRTRLIMQSQQENMKDEVLESPISTTEEVLPVIRRNKGPARCYFVMMAVVYLALLLTAVIALASFGIKQADIVKLIAKSDADPDQTCILFAKHTTVLGADVVELNSPGVCGYVLWGLISITIVPFVWFVYSIVLAVIAPKM